MWKTILKTLIISDLICWVGWAGFVIAFQTSCDQEIATGNQLALQQVYSYLKPGFPF